MLHPDYMLQIAKQQQMEYIKRAEQFRLASQANGVGAVNNVRLPALLDRIFDRLMIFNNGMRKMNRDALAEQSCACVV